MNIRDTLKETGIDLVEFARYLGLSPQSFNYKLNENALTPQEHWKIAAMMLARSVFLKDKSIELKDYVIRGDDE